MSSYDDLFAEGMDQPEIQVPMDCLGLSLDCSNAEDFGQPVEVVVIAKVIQGGEFGYRMVSTTDLQSVEAMGMIRWAQLLVEEGVLAQAKLPDGECEEEGEV